jgi:hypothetical protein
MLLNTIQINMVWGVDWIRLVQMCSHGGFCEYGNEHQVSTKGDSFLD